MKMIGKKISGRYHLLEHIGGGGMAHVYRAHDIILNRMVAVKILQPQYSNDEQFIKRFRREAQAATSLFHPNVVTIYDVGEEDDIYYIVMEYIEGSTLKEYIQNKKRLPLDEAIHIMQQILSAISHAHMHHIVHRDIKPHNILISKDKEAKVTDFGIARAMSNATITHTNSVMGSVHYLSPEQARGGVVNYKSDIYSLGIVFYEMITGQVPFSGDTAVSIALKHLQNEIPSPKNIVPDLPQSIENIILKATAKDPLHRYNSVQEMEEDLRTALDPERINEPKFTIPSVEGEETKAIPIIQSKWESVKENETTIEAPERKEKPEPEEAAPKKKTLKKKIRKYFLIAFALLFMIVLVFVVLPALWKVEEVKVPDVVEKEFEEAEKILENLGLVVVREDVYDDEIEEGYVVRQDPIAGSVVKENAEVRLFVSKGKEKTEVPDVIGENRSKAERILRNAGFENIDFIPQQSNLAADTIIDQLPKANEMVVASEVTVTLYYAVEPAIRLSNLRGLHRSEAERYLREEGLMPKFVMQYSDSVQKDYIISQHPEPLSQVRRGSEVTLTVSLGPEPKPEPKMKTIEVPITVQISEEEQLQGLEFEIRIVYNDATTNGDVVFVEEILSKTKTYRLPLQVSEEKPGEYKLYINGELEKSNKYYY